MKPAREYSRTPHRHDTMLTRLKHAGKMLLQPDYRSRHREFCRLQALPKYTATTTNLLGAPLEVTDAPAFLHMHLEIFERAIYRFQSETPRPLILDGGANIGLSALYFKRLHPQSRIVAFEPDENTFQVLRRNLQSFGAFDVEVHNKALWNAETTLEFIAEGADAGRVAAGRKAGELKGVARQVQAVRLRPYLQQPVEFLKLDIEGAETCVLEDCRDLLGNVRHIFVEYHSFTGRPQTLPRVLEILQQTGFRFYVQPLTNWQSPFVRREIYLDMDLLLNIFGFRDENTGKAK